MLKNWSEIPPNMLPFLALLGYAFATCLAFHEMVRQFGVIVPGGVDACLTSGTSGGGTSESGLQDRNSSGPTIRTIL